MSLNNTSWFHRAIDKLDWDSLNLVSLSMSFIVYHCVVLANLIHFSLSRRVDVKEFNTTCQSGGIKHILTYGGLQSTIRLWILMNLCSVIITFLSVTLVMVTARPYPYPPLPRYPRDDQMMAADNSYSSQPVSHKRVSMTTY